MEETGSAPRRKDLIEWCMNYLGMSKAAASTYHYNVMKGLGADPIGAKEAYKELSQKSSELGEGNDCTVRAIAVATGISYEKALQYCRKHGKTPKRGMFDSQWLAALKETGAKVKDVTSDLLDTRVHVGRYSTVHRKGISMKNVLKVLSPHKKYIVGVSGHVAGVKNGMIIDWAGQSRRNVNRIYEVTK